MFLVKIFLFLLLIVHEILQSYYLSRRNEKLPFCSFVCTCDRRTEIALGYFVTRRLSWRITFLFFPFFLFAVYCLRVFNVRRKWGAGNWKVVPYSNVGSVLKRKWFRVERKTFSMKKPVFPYILKSYWYERIFVRIYFFVET